jgi:hypothetical protein
MSAERPPAVPRSPRSAASEAETPAQGVRLTQRDAPTSDGYRPGRKREVVTVTLGDAAREKLGRVAKALGWPRSRVVEALIERVEE